MAAHVRVYEGRVVQEAIPDGEFMVLKLKGKAESVRVSKKEYDRKVTRVPRQTRPDRR